MLNTRLSDHVHILTIYFRSVSYIFGCHHPSIDTWTYEILGTCLLSLALYFLAKYSPHCDEELLVENNRAVCFLPFNTLIVL